jgi:hypothetical protein
MSKNPANLALRFVLELAALAALGYWGWTTHNRHSAPSEGKIGINITLARTGAECGRYTRTGPNASPVFDR